MPGYFETLGVRLLAGRDFTSQDRPSSNNEMPKVIIINEHMARHYFAGRDPIGQFVKISEHRPPVANHRRGQRRAQRDLTRAAGRILPPAIGRRLEHRRGPAKARRVDRHRDGADANGVCRSRQGCGGRDRAARGCGTEHYRPRSAGRAPVGRLRRAGHRPGDHRPVCGDRAFGQQPDARDRHSHRDRRRCPRRHVDGAEATASR